MPTEERWEGREPTTANFEAAVARLLQIRGADALLESAGSTAHFEAPDESDPKPNGTKSKQY
jgi:hypothetical protein